MTDIVERLRKASVYEEYKAILSNLGDDAADEIERLRAALKQAAEICEEHADDAPIDQAGQSTARMMREAAKTIRALAREPA